MNIEIGFRFFVGLAATILMHLNLYNITQNSKKTKVPIGSSDPQKTLFMSRLDKSPDQ
jgi:hypothetical protein